MPPGRGETNSDGLEAVALMVSTTRLLVEICFVDLGVILPFVRHSILGKDRAYRTHRLACTAVDALVGMDEVHVVCIRCIYAVNRTDIKALCVRFADARFRDVVGHFWFALPLRTSGRNRVLNAQLIIARRE